MANKHLEHHGIKGQKWGDRNGPPYPLKPSAHSAAEKKQMGNSKSKKVKGFDRDGNDMDRLAARESIDKENQKKLLIRAITGDEKVDMSKINIESFSADELRTINDFVNQRNQLANNLNNRRMNNIRKYTDPISNVANTANSVLSVANNVTNLKNAKLNYKANKATKQLETQNNLQKLKIENELMKRTGTRGEQDYKWLNKAEEWSNGTYVDHTKNKARPKLRK